MKKVYLLSAMLILITSSLKASQDIYKAQAMFIYNFARLVQWPGVNVGDFVIGVYGESNLTKELQDYLKDKMIYGQTVVVKECSTVREAASCHILFVPGNKSQEMESLSVSLSATPVLIITEKQNLIHEGAAISFKLETDRLKYQMNADNINSRKLIYNKTLENMAVN